MEQQIATTADGQVVIQPIQSVAPQQVQVMQMNPKSKRPTNYGTCGADGQI